MDNPSYVPREAPADEAETILMLRASLRTMTDALEEVLEHGVPRRGRSANDKESFEQWHEDKWVAIARARRALELSADT